MLYSLRDRLRRARFDGSVRAIRKTPPIAVPEAATIVILSLVSRGDLLMYLVAVKSLLRFLPAASVAVIDDGSLGKAGHATLNKHLPGLKLIKRDTIDTGPVPPDPMWQRLFASIALAANAYVVQLDSDTVTLGCPETVSEMIAANRSFIHGTNECRTIEPLPARVAVVAGKSSQHIQTVAERAMIGLTNSANLRYVRGSAGFYGMGKNSVTASQAADLFLAMDRLTGGRFIEYGSEQFAANFLIANSESAAVLPYPDYAVHDPAQNLAGSRFLHFIGSNRFDGGTYVRAARQVIAELLLSQ